MNRNISTNPGNTTGLGPSNALMSVDVALSSLRIQREGQPDLLIGGAAPAGAQLFSVNFVGGASDAFVASSVATSNALPNCEATINTFRGLLPAASVGRMLVTFLINSGAVATGDTINSRIQINPGVAGAINPLMAMVQAGTLAQGGNYNTVTINIPFVKPGPAVSDVLLHSGNSIPIFGDGVTFDVVVTDISAVYTV